MSAASARACSNRLRDALRSARRAAGSCRPVTRRARPDRAAQARGSRPRRPRRRRRLDPQIDAEAAMLRDHVRRRAARDHADRRRHAAGVIGHRLNGENLARRLADGVAAVRVARARMGRAAFHLHVEAPDPFPRGDDLAAFARRLGDEHVGRAAGEILDQPARRRAADLLVRREQEDQRAPRPRRAAPPP